MNRTIKLLLLSDIFVLTGFGLVQPILAVFIKDDLQDGRLYMAGLASMLFLLTKSFVQLPFSRYVDKYDHSILWLIIGTVLISIVPFIYMFSTQIEMIYVAQVIYGIGSGLAFPTWLGLWSKNLDRSHASYEWSLYSTLVGLGTAGSAAIGAALTEYIGFRYTFFIVGVLSVVGCLILLELHQKEVKLGKTSLGKKRN